MGCFSFRSTDEIVTTKNTNQANNNKKEDKGDKGDKGESQINNNLGENQLSFNLELCKSISDSLPNRINTDYQSLKDTIKSKTIKLSKKEKSYVVFLWICENISYDAASYFSGKKVDCTPEGVFKNGTSVCSGYSYLFKDISTYIDLEVECVSCYSKGVGYEPGKMLTKTDHEYNLIKIQNKWYPIDSTWGAGHIERNTFVKCLNEYYFFANPEFLIKTHFPENEQYQLTKKKYTLNEFLKWPLVKMNFYKYGFTKFTPEEGLINLKNKNEQTFIIYGDNMEQKTALCNIYLLEGNIYNQLLNLSCINFYRDRFEVNCIFNKKGKYKVIVFGNSERGKSNNMDILEYIINVDENAEKELSFPHSYKGKEDINIIEPLYNNLKSGEKVKFKIKSNLEEIIIIDEKWNYLKKNDDGYFIFETNIQTAKGGFVTIGKKKPESNYNLVFTYL